MLFIDIYLIVIYILYIIFIYIFILYIYLISKYLLDTWYLSLSALIVKTNIINIFKLIFSLSFQPAINIIPTNSCIFTHLSTSTFYTVLCIPECTDNTNLHTSFLISVSSECSILPHKHSLNCCLWILLLFPWELCI